MENNLIKIVQILNNGINSLSRKFDALASELRNQNNRKQPNAPMSSKTDFNMSLPDSIGDSISKSIKDSLDKIEIPQPKITMPEMKAPVVNVPVPIVNIPAFKFPKIPAPIVNVPPANITVEPAKVEFPKEMKVEGMDKLLESVNRETPAPVFDFNSKNPLAVMVVDSRGKQISDFKSDLTAPSMVAIRVGTSAVGSTNPLPVTTDGFAIPMFDTQEIDESAAPGTTTITYKLDSVVVATKVITVAGTLTTITVTLV